MARVNGRRLDVHAGLRVLDVAAGTGSITRLLTDTGATVVSLDQSNQMLEQAVARGATGVRATAESLPFPDESFDRVTFGYLLRYVADVPAAMRELARAPTRRPDGMVEFGRPAGIWGRRGGCTPASGCLWREASSAAVGGRGELSRAEHRPFCRWWPSERLTEAWRQAG